MNLTLIERLLRQRLTFAPTDEGVPGGGTGGDPGAGGGDPGAGGGNDTAPGAGGTDTVPGAGGEDTVPGGDGGDTKPWYETHEWKDPALKNYLVQNGYNQGTMEDALERALKSDQSAMKKLGKGPDALMDKPGKDTPLSDFFKANASTFGVPDKADGYELTLPEDLPEGLPVDEALLGSFKAKAHELGLPTAMAQQMVDFHAETVKAQLLDLEGKAATAEQAMLTQLNEEWGGNTKENTEAAKRAFQAVAAQAGLNADQLRSIASKLNADTGDAGLLKLGLAMSKALTEDGLSMPGGGNSDVMSIEQAKTAKAQIMEARTGEMAQARTPAAKKAVQQKLDRVNAVLVANGAA